MEGWKDGKSIRHQLLPTPYKLLANMSLQGFAQATEAVKRAKRALLVAPENSTPDAVAAVSAALAYLLSHSLTVEALVPNVQQDKLPTYLPHREKLQAKIGGTRDFRISVDVGRVPIHELSYDVKDGKLHILLTPKNGEWEKKDVDLRPGEDRYDLVVAFGCPDRAELAKVFHDNSDFAYRVPVINLDYEPKNEHWAPINLVDLTASSVTEVLFSWLADWSENKIDENMATALLSGMIANTQSFRTPQVTPQTLERAAKLVSMGADREAVVHHLWRTRPVNTLKLWGRALSRLEQDMERGFVWTTLSRQDIVDSGATEARLDEMVQELIAYSPGAKLACVMVEHDAASTRVALFAQPPYEANHYGKALGLDGSKQRASGAIAKPLLEAKDFVVQSLRQQLR